MTDQLVTSETNYTLIQIQNVKQSISIVEKSADSISIPGANLFFKYITFVLNKDNPTDTQQVLNELERIDKKLDNSFNITLSALDTNNLRTNITSAKSSMEEVSHLVRMDQDVSGSYEQRIQKEVSNLHRLAEEQINLGKYALVDFERANSTGNGELKTLIGEYLKISSFVAETISYMQYSYNMVLQSNLKVEKQLGEEFKGSNYYKIGNEIEDYSKTILDSYNDFLSKELPGNVPKWCKKIFLGEKFQLKNRWCDYGLHIEKGNFNWTLDVYKLSSHVRSNLKLSLDEDSGLWDFYAFDGDAKEIKVFSSNASKGYKGTIPLLMWCKSSKEERDKKDKYTILYDFESLVIQYPRKSSELICVKTISYPERRRNNEVVTSKMKTSEVKAQWTVV